MASPLFLPALRACRVFCGLLIATLPFNQPLFAQAPAAAPAGTWAQREIGNLQLEAPFGFKDFPDVAAGIPDNIRATLEKLESALGGSEDTFMVTVTSFTYKPGVTVSLDGAVKGATAATAARLGDSNPQFTTAVTKVSTLEARTASYQKTIADGRTVYLKSVVIMRGQSLWQVQALSLGDKPAPDIARLLASVAIKAAP